ncbi:MAG: hypothetical protein PHQ40_14380 [Anaerolineaceae bacterium]|nr:hypothetical protein [Anaerolineaceae bacterium]
MQKQVHAFRLICLLGLFALIFGTDHRAAAYIEREAPEVLLSSSGAQPINLACGSGQATLLNPANETNLSALYTSFRFTPVAGVNTYVLEVATESTFSTMEPEKSERGYQFAIPDPSVSSFEWIDSLSQNFLPETIYYWRVTPKCNAVLGIPSQVFRFTTPANGIVLPAPTLDKPADQSHTLATGITFTWQAVSDASTYQIRFYHYLSDATSDSSYLSKADGNVMDIRQPSDYISEFPADMTFYWRVGAVNSYAVGELSPVFAFTTPLKTNTKIIGADGGRLITPSGVQVYFSPGVLTEPTEIHFDLNPHPSVNPPFKYGNRSFDLTATHVSDGTPVTEFWPWVDIRIVYTDEDLAYARINGPQTLELNYWNGTGWGFIILMDHNLEEHWVQYRVTHFTEFALGSAERIFIPLVVR